MIWCALQNAFQANDEHVKVMPLLAGHLTNEGINNLT